MKVDINRLRSVIRTADRARLARDETSAASASLWDDLREAKAKLGKTDTPAKISGHKDALSKAQAAYDAAGEKSALAQESFTAAQTLAERCWQYASENVELPPDIRNWGQQRHLGNVLEKV